jgi:hypothetical protein
MPHLLLKPLRVAAIEDVCHGEGVPHGVRRELAIRETRPPQGSLEVALNVALAMGRPIAGCEHPGRHRTPPALEGEPGATALDGIDTAPSSRPTWTSRQLATLFGRVGCGSSKLVFVEAYSDPSVRVTPPRAPGGSYSLFINCLEWACLGNPSSSWSCSRVGDFFAVALIAQAASCQGDKHQHQHP